MCMPGMFGQNVQPSQTIIQRSAPPPPPAPPAAPADTPVPNTSRSPEVQGRSALGGFSTLIIPRTAFPAASKNITSGGQ